MLPEIEVKISLIFLWCYREDYRGVKYSKNYRTLGGQKSKDYKIINEY